MTITRWIVARRAPDGWPEAVREPLRRSGTSWALRADLDGTNALYECEFQVADLEAVQDLVQVLPSLATPIDRVVASLLCAFPGIELQEGDTVLNLLRKFRDSKGEKWSVDLPR